MTVVAVIAPHPDDETLGCGGALLRHKEDGDEIHWIIMTTIFEDSVYSKNAVASRKAEIEKVAMSYGFDSVHQFNFKTTELDQIPIKERIEEITTCFKKIQPQVLYIPNRYDVHSDHKSTHDAVLACTKSFRHSFIRSVRVYETISETEFSMHYGGNGFQPNLWVDVSKYVDKKIEIMKLYSGEMKEHPFPRSEKNIRALATLRGATINTEYAESFLLLKEII